MLSMFDITKIYKRICHISFACGVRDGKQIPFNTLVMHEARESIVQYLIQNGAMQQMSTEKTLKEMLEFL